MGNSILSTFTAPPENFTSHHHATTEYTYNDWVSGILGLIGLGMLACVFGVFFVVCSSTKKHELFTKTKKRQQAEMSSKPMV